MLITKKNKIKNMTDDERKLYQRQAAEKHKLKVQLEKGITVQIKTIFEQPMVEKELYDTLYKEYTEILLILNNLLERKNSKIF